MYNLLPQSRSVDFLLHFRVCRVNRELLHIRTVLYGCPHKLIVYLHRHIGSGHLPLGHLGVNERFRVGMFDRHRHHQRPAASVLSHLAGRVGVTLHKRNQTRRSQRRVLYRRTFRTDVGKVVPYPAPAFHQLHLLFVDTDNGTIRIGFPIQPDNETIRQRSNLIVIPDARHRTSLRNDVLEMVEQAEQLLCAQSVRILGFDASHFVRNAPVHVLRRLFIDMPERIFHRILVHPYAGSKLVSFKIIQRGIIRFVVTVRLFFHD